MGMMEAALKALVWLFANGFELAKSHRRCARHRPIVGRSLSYESAKPTPEWLKANGAVLHKRRTMDIPSPVYEAWWAVCLRCGELLRAGSTDRFVAWPPVDNGPPIGLVSAGVKLWRLELEEVGPTPDKHKWAASWELVELSRMNMWHGE